MVVLLDSGVSPLHEARQPHPAWSQRPSCEVRACVPGPVGSVQGGRRCFWSTSRGPGSPRFLGPERRPSDRKAELRRPLGSRYQHWLWSQTDQKGAPWAEHHRDAIPPVQWPHPASLWDRFRLAERENGRPLRVCADLLRGDVESLVRWLAQSTGWRNHRSQRKTMEALGGRDAPRKPGPPRALRPALQVLPVLTWEGRLRCWGSVWGEPGSPAPHTPGG